MKRLFFTLIFLWGIISSIHAQVVTTDPDFPTADQPVTIYFDATEGTGGLADFSGDVYAHTGVITDQSENGSDWKYVVADWGENVAKIKMERAEGEPNLYKLSISPSIREYYGVPENEKIEQMAFVFRNSDGSKEGKADGGKDIFAKVYENDFNVKLLHPTENPTFVNKNDSVTIKGIASSDQTTELSLHINNQQVKTVSNDTLTHTYTAQTAGNSTIMLTGTDGSFSDTLSQQLIVNPDINEQARPANLQDGITYVDANTVRLSLFAPGKEYVYIIGDFNNWQPQPEYFMNRETVNADSTYYWLEFDVPQSGKEYAFQYLVDGELRIADPYSEKVLDPFNDSAIAEQTYPNLKPYPQDKTNKIAGILQPGKQDYNWQYNKYERPPQEELVTYELLVRDFVDNHDFATLTDTLGYLDSLGVNAIELMPVMEFDANSSWGYNPTFHLATDKYYGPAKELKKFIDEAHSRGMVVILDMVLNHAWGPSPLVRLWNDGDFGKPTSENPYLNREVRHDFNVGYDFNHESQATQYFVDRVNRYWLNEFNFDGFRFDLSKGFTQKNTLGNVSAWGQYDASRVRLLKRMADQIWATDDSAYVILEHFAENQEEKELSDYGIMLWGNANEAYTEATMGFHENGKSNFSHVSYSNRGWNQPNLVGYMESHDEERLMYKNLQFGNSSDTYDIKELKTALERNKMAAAFFLPIPGPKLIWQFGELGYDININKNGRTGEKPIKWEYYSDKNRKKLYDTYKALLRLRNSHPAFTSKDSQVSLNVNGALKSIRINHPELEALIIGNFDVVTREITPTFTSSGKWYRFFRGDSVTISDTDTTLTLEPGRFHIYTDQKFESPDKDLLNTTPTHIDVKISKPFDGSTSPQDFRLIALPGQVNEKLSEVLQGEPDVTWQAFWDNGKADNYMIKYDGSSTFSLKPGIGFWVTSKQNFTYDQTITTVNLNENNQASIPLHDGWNIISNPLDIDVSWNNVSETNGGNLQPIWRFDGSYNKATDFVSARSGEAFYFLNDQGLNNLLIPYEGNTTKKKTTTKKKELRLITQVAEDTTSSSSLILTGRNATSSPDVVAPPSGFEGPSLRFADESKKQGSTRTNAFARIYRSANQQGHRIKLVLKATPGKAVKINLDGWTESSIQKIALLNPNSGRKYNLKENSEIKLTPEKSQTSLLLVIGDTSYINEQQKDFLPKEIEVIPNYPNPFNPSTTLRFRLPEQMQVRVQVYDILGRRVSTLINDEVRQAGVHTITFDASRQSSGMYFAVFEIGSRRFVQKMMLIK